MWSGFMQKWIDHTASLIAAERERGAAPETISAVDLATSLNQMNERTMMAALSAETRPSMSTGSSTPSRTSGSPAFTANLK